MAEMYMAQITERSHLLKKILPQELVQHSHFIGWTLSIKVTLLLKKYIILYHTQSSTGRGD